MICPYCTVESHFKPLSFSPPKGQIDYLVIRNFPEPADQITQTPLHHDTGQLFKLVMAEHGHEEAQYAVYHLCCCNPGKNSKGEQKPLTKEQILLSHLRLTEVIKQVCPKRIIMLGIDPINALWGYGKSVKKGRDLKLYRGLWHDYDLYPDYKIPVYTLFEPRQLFEAPMFFDDFEGDISRLRQMGYLPQPKVVVVNNAVETGRVLKNYIQFNYEVGDEGVRGFDIETSGLDFHFDSDDEIVSLSICADSETVYIWPQQALRSRMVRNALQEYFDDTRLRFTGSNVIAFDCPFLYHKLGLNVPAKYDLMLMHFLIDERRGTHNLKRMAHRYFGIPNWEQGIVAAKEKQKIEGKAVNYGDMEQSMLFNYQAYDTAASWLLYHKFYPIIKRDFNDLYHNIIYPGARLIENIATRGMKVDVEYLKRLEKEWEIELSEYQSTLNGVLVKYNSPDLNLNSTQQLSKFLHENLKLPRVNAKTVAKTGAAKMDDKFDSTSEAVLNYLEPKDETGFVTALLSYRRLAGLKSKYCTGLINLVDKNHIIYPHLFIPGAETGRLSCSNPNLMGFPKHDKSKRKERGLVPYADQIRYAFVARPGYKIVTSDFAQIELRVLAYLSQDANMLAAFASGIDFHEATAEKAFGGTDDAILKKKWRQWAKAINFGIVFGQSAKSLATGLGVTPEQAVLLVNAVLDAYPKLKAYLASEKNLVFERGYSESLFGRRRRVSLVPNQKFQGAYQRMAGNHPPQSSASDLNFLAAIELDQKYGYTGEVNVLLLIHDDLLAEVPIDEAEKYAKIIVEVQEKQRLPYRGIVFKAEPEIMDRWAKNEDEGEEEIEVGEEIEVELTMEEVFAK